MVSEIFCYNGGREVQNGQFHFVHSFTKCSMATEQTYLSKKKLSDFGWIISIPNSAVTTGVFDFGKTCPENHVLCAEFDDKPHSLSHAFHISNCSVFIKRLTLH